MPILLDLASKSQSGYEREQFALISLRVVAKTVIPSAAISKDKQEIDPTVGSDASNFSEVTSCLLSHMMIASKRLN